MSNLVEKHQGQNSALSFPSSSYASRLLSPQVYRDIEDHVLSEYPEVSFKMIAPNKDGKEIFLSLVSTSLSQNQITALAQQVSLLSGMPSEVSCLCVDQNTIQSPYASRLLPILSSQVDLLSATIRKGSLHLTFAGAIQTDVLNIIERELVRGKIELKVEGVVSTETPHTARALPSYKIINGCALQDNLISALASEDVAYLFSHTLLRTSLPEHRGDVLKSIQHILREELPENNYAVTQCGANVVLTFDRSLFTSASDTLYNTLHRIHASVPLTYPLIVNYVPLLAPSFTSIVHEVDDQKTIDFCTSLEVGSPDLAVSCGRHGYSTLYQNALSRLGTRECWYFIENVRAKTFHLFTDQEQPERIKKLIQEAEQLVADKGYTFSVHKLTLNSLESLHSSPTRDSVSIREWRDIITFSNQACIGSIKDSPVRAVYSLGSIVVIETDFILPESSQNGIRKLLRMVPAPIMFKAKSAVAPSLTLNAIKSIVKLGLPRGSVLHTWKSNKEKLSESSTSGEEISFSIIGHRRDEDQVHTMCRQLQGAIKDKRLDYTVESYTKEVSTKVGSFASPLYRFLLTGISPNGEVDLQNKERHVAKKSSRSLIGHREEEGWIRSLASSHKDATDLFCWTYDPMGASLKEDALSVKIDGRDSFTLTVHLSNVALSCHPFSPERHKAYRLGESLYDSSRNAVPMLPNSWLFSLNVGAIRPVISVSWSFIRNAEGVWDLARTIPDISNELISVKAALSPDIQGRTIAVQGPLPSSSVQFCSEVAAKVLMTGKLIHSGDGFAQWAVNQQQQHFLGHANLALGNYLRSSNLPLVYQRLERPSFEDFKNFSGKLTLKEFRKISPLSLDEIYSNDDFLRRFIMRVKDYYRFSKKGSKAPFSMLGQPTLQPDYHFIYGEEGVALFNAPARRALSLVNTHQFSAFQGLVEPMSPSEVNEVFSIYQENKRMPFRENSTITLSRQLELMRRREYSRLRAVVTELKPGKVGVDAVVAIQNPRLPLTGVIQNIGNEDGFFNLSTLIKGSQLYVTPSSYSHIEDRFYFSIASEQ
jgi:hypothetical protein